MEHFSSQTRYKRSREIQDILNLCDRHDCETVENILLIGKSGAGKSALVNTLIKAITGDYYNRAKVGRGVTQSKTLSIIKYESCGVKADDLRVAGDDCPFSERELRKLPTVYDVPGLGDALTEDIKEILRLLIAGRIPAGTGITGLQQLQKEHGVGNLDIFFDEVDPKAKISKVVFVQSAMDSVPRNLIEGLHSVLEEIDPTTARVIYEGDVFLVITHHDLVQDADPSDSYQTPGRHEADAADSSRRESYGSHDDQTHATSASGLSRAPSRITMSDFARKEQLLSDLFSIGGALERNRLYWRSFCDTTGFNDPAINNIALKFITFMMNSTTPVMPVPAKLEVLVTSKKMEQLKARRALSFTDIWTRARIPVVALRNVTNKVVKEIEWWKSNHNMEPSSPEHVLTLFDIAVYYP